MPSPPPAPSSSAFFESIRAACETTADEALARSRDDSPSAQILELFTCVKRLDLPRARAAWDRLGKLRLDALGSCQMIELKREDLFSWWWRGASDANDLGLQNQAAIDMALWLDDIGASCLGSEQPRLIVDRIAQGGQSLRSVRQETLRHWAYHCENGNFTASAHIPSLIALSDRWLNDPSPASACRLGDWEQAAFEDSSGKPREWVYLQLLSHLFETQPNPPALSAERWGHLARAWAPPFRSPSAISSMNRLLKTGSCPLPPEASSLIARSAIRSDAIRVLQQLARRQSHIPLSFDADDKLLTPLFQPQEHSPASPAPVRGRAPEPCPALIMAAWRSPSDRGGEPARAPYCFEALRLVPEFVHDSQQETPRPERLAPIDHRLWPRLHQLFPAWFSPDEAGDNIAHILVRSIDPLYWESLFSGPIQTLASADPRLASLLGAPNRDGLTPLDELVARIGADHPNAQLTPPALALLSLREAVALRQSIPSTDAPAQASLRL